MRLNELRDNDGATKSRTRVGRGIGSGKGKTGGRGVKGQKSRSGVAIKGFEGGQMPLYQRLPKRGFNKPNRLAFAEVTLGRLQTAVDAGKLDAKAPVDAAALIKAGVIRRAKDGVRVIGGGELTAKLDRMGDLRAGHHALHLGLDHRAAHGGHGAGDGAAEERGRAGAQEAQPVHPLRHRGAGDAQAYGLAVSMESGGLVTDPGWFFRAACVITLVGGTMFLMWLGEQITARGIGNGISLIIFVGIIAEIPAALAQFFESGPLGRAVDPARSSA
jgi:large subunit ribosomal protein L15